MRGHWLWLVIFVLIVPILFESVNAEPPNGRVLVVQNYTPPTIDPSARRVPTRRNIQRCDMTAKLDLQSQTQKRSYDGYMYESVVRMVAMRDGLSSHKISARLTVKNIREEPVTFIFRWYDPEGRVIDESEFTRPDRSSYSPAGHWTLYPIIDDLEFRDMPPGKYTLVVEHPPGELLVERSFNFYQPDKGPDVVSRNRKSIIVIVFGLVLMCLGIVTIRVLA